MHKISPARISPNGAAGFSLVEVALAIGIVAFSFVALLSLIPTGLQKFRESIDTASETWIMQGLNSIVQTTEWEKVYDKGESELSKDIYYFDEEARLTDTKEKPSDDSAVQERRLYAARMFVLPMHRPVLGTEGTYFTRDGTQPIAVRVIGVMVRTVDGESMHLLDALDADSVQNLKSDTRVRVKAFVATQMNAAR
jgi:uncharacterized protein (TIGR02598 family)